MIGRVDIDPKQDCVRRISCKTTGGKDHRETAQDVCVCHIIVGAVD